MKPRATSANVSGMSSPAQGAAPVMPSHSAGMRIDLDSLPFGVVVRDSAFNIVAVNPAYVALSGYPADRLIGRTADSMALPDERDRLLATLTAVAADGQPRHAEQCLVRADGAILRLAVTISAVVEEGNAYFISIVQDVTQHRHVQEELEAALQAQTAILETATAAVLQIRHGRIERINSACERLFGVARKEIVGRSIGELWGNADVYHEHRESARLAFAEGRNYAAELQLRHADGHRIWVSMQARAIDANDGQSPVILTLHDITAHVDMQREHEQTNRRLRALLDGLPDIAWMKDREGRYLAVNERFVERYGGSVDTIVGRRDDELLAPGALDRVRQSDTIVQQSRKVESFEFVDDVGGTRHWYHVRKAPVFDAAGVCIGVSGVARNITETRSQQVEVARLAREQEVMFQMTTVGIAYLRDRVILRCNEALDAMLGYEPGELIGLHTPSLYESRDEFDRVGLILRHATGPLLPLEHHLRRKDGSLVWCAIQTTPIDVADPLGGYISTVVDMTRIREREAALQAVLREQQAIFDNALVGICYVRSDRIEKANPKLAEIFDYEQADLLGMPLSAFYASMEEYEEMRAQGMAAMADGGVDNFEAPFLRRDGGTVWCSVHGRLFDPAQPDKGRIFAVIDISARKRFEESLAAARNLLDMMVENMPIAVAVREAGTHRYVRYNRAAEKMTGLSRAMVLGSTPRDIYPPGMAAILERRDDEVLRAGVVSPVREGVENMVNGRTTTVVRQILPVMGPDGRAEYVMTLAEDVTERIEQEHALRESEMRFRQFAERVDQVIFVTWPCRSEWSYLNDRCRDVLGWTADDIRADRQAIVSRVQEDDLALFDELYRQETAAQPADVEVRYRHPERGLRWLRWRTFPMRDGDEIRVYGLIDDITERRQREEERVQELIQQRDLLVREVHHRIKNNLQGVAGLMQHMARAQPAIRVPLNEVSTQIHAIAQVHGLQVNAGESLRLSDLMNAIFDNLSRILPHPIVVRLDADAVSSIHLPEAEAVPVALVLNELGTNAVKHGGACAVARLEMYPNGGAVVTVENEGSLPVGFDLAKVSSPASGLGLVRSLVPRRGGRLDIVQDGPTVRAILTLTVPAVAIRGTKT